MIIPRLDSRPLPLTKLARTEGGLVARQIHVVGAVIVQDGLVLCAQRGSDGSLPGLWEFPGGKIEPGESRETALKREISEELGCTVEVGREVTTTVHDYEFATVTLSTFYCQLVAGTPELTEHSSLQWLRPEEFETIEWAPADLPALAQIQADFA